MFTKKHIEAMKTYTFDESGRIFDASGKEVTDKLDLIALRTANLIYKETMNAVNEGENYNEALEANLNAINSLRYDKENTQTNLLSQILNGSNHVEREFEAEVSSVEELQQIIAKSGNPVALLIPENLENTKALINFKLLEQDLMLDYFNVNYAYLGKNKWQIRADYKIKKYQKEENVENEQEKIQSDSNVNDINSLEEIQKEIENAKQNLKEAQDKNDAKLIAYYQERIELLEAREVELMVNTASIENYKNMSIEELENQKKIVEGLLEATEKENAGTFVIEHYKKQIEELNKEIQTENKILEWAQKEKVTVNDFLQSTESQNIEKVKKLIDGYKLDLSTIPDVYRGYNIIKEIVSKLEEHLSELNNLDNNVVEEKDVDEFTSIEEIEKEIDRLKQQSDLTKNAKERVEALLARKEEIKVDAFLQSTESQNIEKVNEWVETYFMKPYLSEPNSVESNIFNKIVSKLEERLSELKKQKKDRDNDFIQYNLYADETPIHDGMFTIDEFHNYLRDYSYEEGIVYERKNSEEVTDKETILKMKAIVLVDTLARQEIKEKTNGYDPVILSDGIIYHYLHIFSEEKIENNDMNRLINEILKSNGHFEYTIDAIQRTERSIEEDIKEFVEKYKQSALKLFINPLRDCTEAVITLLQRKKGIIQENINTLIEEEEGKVKLTVDFFTKKQGRKIEPNLELDVLSVKEVRFYIERYGISTPESYGVIYSLDSGDLVMEEDLILKVRIAHLIYNYAKQSEEVTDEDIQAAIADFSTYGKDENGSLSPISVYLLSLISDSDIDKTNKEIEVEKEFEINKKDKDLQKVLYIFNAENLENTKALLKVMFNKQMEMNLEFFDITFSEEADFKKIKVNYKLSNPNIKDLNEDKVLHIPLFSTEDIKYFAKTYKINKQGQLVIRDENKLVTDESTIVQACSAKFIYHVVRYLKKQETYQFNSFDENISIAYEKVLNNYVINDILNNHHIEYTKNENERDEDLEMVFDENNRYFLKFYIRDQFRECGYDIQSFKMTKELIGNGQIRYAIDYKLIKLEQTVENEEVEEQTLTNFTPSIAINILTNFIDEPIEDAYKLCSLSEKRILLNINTNNKNIHEQYMLQIRQKAIDLIENYNHIKTLSDIYERGLSENNDIDINYAFIHLEELKANFERLGLTENEKLLLNENQQNAFWNLITNAKEIFVQYNIGIQEENESNYDSNQEIFDYASVDDSNYDFSQEMFDYASVDDSNNLDKIYSIITKINNDTLTYSDLNYYYSILIDLLVEADVNELHDLADDLEMIKFNLELLMSNCSEFYYWDEYNKKRNVFVGGALYINDLLTNKQKYIVKKNVNADEKIQTIKELLVSLKNQVEDLNIDLASSNEFESFKQSLLMKCQKKEIKIIDLINAKDEVDKLKKKARKGKCDDIEISLFEIRNKLTTIYKELNKILYLEEIVNGTKKSGRIQSIATLHDLKINDFIEDVNLNDLKIYGTNLEKSRHKIQRLMNELFNQLYDFQIDNNEMLKINFANNKKNLKNILKTNIFRKDSEDNSFKL